MTKLNDKFDIINLIEEDEQELKNLKDRFIPDEVAIIAVECRLNRRLQVLKCVVND